MSTQNLPPDNETLTRDIEELAQIHLDLQDLRNRASGLLGRIAGQGTGAAPAYGAIAEVIAEDAAVVVDARRHAEFAAASFDGDNLRTQARLCHVLGDLRSVAELLSGDASAAQLGATTQLGGTLALVVDITQYSLQNPFAKDPEVLDTVAAPLLRRVEKYRDGIQAKKGLLGRFREALSSEQSEKNRLAEEVQLLRGAPAPAAKLELGKRPVPPAPRAGRRARRPGRR